MKDLELLAKNNVDYETGGSNVAIKDDEQHQPGRGQKPENRDDKQQNFFYVTVKNENKDKTFFVIAINQISFSESRYEILPTAQVTMKFPKGNDYMLVYFDRNEGRTMVKLISEVNELSDGVYFSIK